MVLGIILNWNGARDTLCCLPTVLAQKNSELELLIIDNDSRDDSVVQIRQAFPAIELLESEHNLGFGGGCNLGIKIAIQRDCEFVWLLNNDTRVADDALAQLLQMARADTSIGAVGSVIYDLDSPHTLQLWGGGTVNTLLGTSHLLKSPGPVDFLSGASLLLRVEALRQVGAFDDQNFFMYWEDTDLGRRLTNAGWRLAVAPGSQVWHAESSSLGKGSPLRNEYFTRSAIAFMKKHSRLPGLSIALNALLRIGKQLYLFQWSDALDLAKLYLRILKDSK